MSCAKHGYTNNVFCPACDLETIEANKMSIKTDRQSVELEANWRECPKSTGDMLLALLKRAEDAERQLRIALDAAEFQTARLQAENRKHELWVMEAQARAIGCEDLMKEAHAERDMLRTKLADAEARCNEKQKRLDKIIAKFGDAEAKRDELLQRLADESAAREADKVDAERYRWLKKNARVDIFYKLGHTVSDAEAYIDAALSAERVKVTT